ncbi:MAG: GSCFA domain-containing protein [Proteobacteria bacterium]|nr:GSCFA domain-containing protein [Pseudomonadota bacterium]
MATPDSSESPGDALAVDQAVSVGQQIHAIANQIAGAQDAEARAALIALIGDNQSIRDAWLLFSVLQFLRGDEPKALSLFARSVTCGAFAENAHMLLRDIVERRGGEALEDFLRTNGMRPLAPIGKLGGALRSSEVDPWEYSPSTVNLFPRRQSEFNDMSRLIDRFVLKDIAPTEPMFDPDDRIFTLGSCFALELRNYLTAHGVDSEWLYVPEGLNNTFAILDFIEWVVTGEAARDAYWYDEAAIGGAVKWAPGEEQKVYREFLETVSGIVLTIGLAEVWQDTQTGGVFWRGVPKSLYDPERHGTRMSEVEENRDNISRIIALIRQVKPTAPIVLTLSPIPLSATNRPESSVMADSLSKSILRVAIDQVMAAHAGDENLFYWPSFEVFRGLGQHWPEALLGEDGYSRHVNRKVVNLMMEHFVKRYWRQVPGC